MQIVCPFPRKLLWIAALLESLQLCFIHFHFKKEIGFEYIRWINGNYCYCFNLSIYCTVSLRGKELNRECSNEFLINKRSHPFCLHCSIVSGPCLFARGRFFSVLSLPKMGEWGELIPKHLYQSYISRSYLFDNNRGSPLDYCCFFHLDNCYDVLAGKFYIRHCKWGKWGILRNILVSSSEGFFFSRILTGSSEVIH